MPAPDLAYVKAVCRLDDNRHDLTLPVCIGAATQKASHETGVDYSVQPMPDAVKQWVALYARYLCELPGVSVDVEVKPFPARLDGLLDPYRTYGAAPA